MSIKLSRRELLKLMGLPPLYYGTKRLFKSSLEFSNVKPQNIIVIVFDAFSALNMSLYGYSRDTTPHMNRLANRAVIYHNHYSSSNFTSPGTASLLTGTYPWTHRGIELGAEVHASFSKRNMFHLFDDYYRFSYSHNHYVNTLQNQFEKDIDLYLPKEDLIIGNNIWVPSLFKKDEDIATLSWIRTMGNQQDGFAYSLILSTIYQMIQEQKTEDYQQLFPRGLPKAISGGQYFILEDAIDWIISAVTIVPRPFLSYIHLLPPHDPYNTRRDFVDIFKDDDWAPVKKPTHYLSKIGLTVRKQTPEYYRRLYDEFVLYIDAEFNRLYRALEKMGILDNTWIILTTDHGEMFERGIVGHITPSLNQPIVRIPLVIFKPGQTSRQDVFVNTSAVDVLPTLLSLSGYKIPDWIEGEILPPFGKMISNERCVFALDAKLSEPLKPLKTASAMIIKGQFKLIYYFGYKVLIDGEPIIELFNVGEDPEEMNDLSPTHQTLAANLLDELKDKLKSADEAFQRINQNGSK